MIRNDIEFFILCAILLILLLVVGIAYAKIMRTNRKRDEELSRLVYSLLQKARELDDDYYALKEQNQQYANDIKRLQEMINSLGVLEQKNASSISSLTSSIQNTLQENRRRIDEKIYPTPQLSEMITTTIDEFIRQEIVLMKDMRVIISPEDPVTIKITRNVIRTYPHVDEEYLAKKVIQRIQEAVRE
jgi:hypothetical protein